jgi:hypothetical protein
MPATYEPIATTTLSNAANTITFSSISGSYTDLVLVSEGTQSANQYIAIRFNSDTTSNYSFTRIQGNGTTAASARGTSETFGRLGIGNPTNRYSVIAQIQNYANTTTYKTWLSRSNIPADFVGALVGLWRKTPEAINTIQILTTTTDTFQAGSTFSLYGIKSA